MAPELVSVHKVSFIEIKTTKLNCKTRICHAREISRLDWPIKARRSSSQCVQAIPGCRPFEIRNSRNYCSNLTALIASN